MGAHLRLQPPGIVALEGDALAPVQFQNPACNVVKEVPACRTTPRQVVLFTLHQYQVQKNHDIQLGAKAPFILVVRPRITLV
jgi:hypothetical protein